ncbi:GNAT family N-acetyltransferase, partial [Polymorphobacter multimanifer]
MIRPAIHADIPLLPAIEAAAAMLFRGTHVDGFADAWPNRPETFARAHRAGLLWIAEQDGVPAGFVFGEACPEGLYVRELSVAPRAQQRGLGAALMRTAIAHARALGWGRVLLTTDRTLPWNAPFYARLGFVLVDDAIPPTLRARLAQQARDGFPMQHRCAMLLDCHEQGTAFTAG